MLIQFEEYLTFENIYIWSTFGVLPFWAMLVFIPNSKFSQILINSIILPLILAGIYVYVLYQEFLLKNNFFDTFSLYLGLDNLYAVFSEKSFMLLFWLHFLTINLFLGSWISRDALKYSISKKIVFLPLVLIYFTGPVGLVLYWMVRIFFSKKLGFHD
jgi:hypothetical protein